MQSRGSYSTALKSNEQAEIKEIEVSDLHNKLSQAAGLHQDGDLRRAGIIYQEILERHPDNADTLHLAGLLARQQGDSQNAVALITRAIHIFPHNSCYHNSLGLAFQALGEQGKATACYRRAIAVDPLYAEAHYNLGVMLHHQDKLDEALGCFKKALESQPDLSEAYESIGIVLQAKGDYTKAAASFCKAIEFRPRDTELYHHLGRLLENLGELDEAVECYRRMLAIQPRHARACNDLGLVFRDQGKLDDALASLQKAVEIDPQYAEAHHNLGTLLQDRGHLQAACESYRQTLAIQPEFARAYNNLGMAYQEMGNPKEAVACFRKALDIQPDYAAVHRHLVHQLQKDCSWSEMQAVGARLDRLTSASLEAGQRPAEDPFVNLSRCQNPAYNAAVARAWSADIQRCTAVLKTGFSFDNRRRCSGPITIGYLSCDFHDHPTAHLMLSLFGLHNRDEFKINCYSYGPDDGSRYRDRIKNESDQFIDISEYSHIDAARRIHTDGVDILVDLKGHTKRTRLDILACRPAPVQVHFLGFPGTTGASFIDYFITDRIVTPEDHVPYYAEKLVYLPHSYQVNDHQQEIAPRQWKRAELGLPAEGFVFSSFNLAYKIDPMMFDCWMRILQQTPGSVLWLFGDNETASRNLRKEAAGRGVEPDRLLFAKRLEKSEHLARLRWADMALDTRIVNGHTTTSDALWSGVPVITLQGDHFASRVSSSLLHAIGLSELVTHSLREYEKLAVRLATCSADLLAVRQKLSFNRLRKPLFDTARFVGNLECAYGEMWQIFVEGSKARQFEVRESRRTCKSGDLGLRP